MADDDLDTGTDDQPNGAERRIQQKQDSQAQRELAVVDAGLTLTKDQRVALLAVVGNDLSAETLKTKAEALGMTKPPEQTGPTADELAADQAALTNMGQAAAMSTPPPAPVNELMSLRDRLSRAKPGQMVEGGPLYEQVIEAIQNAGLEFGSVEHGGAGAQFTPMAFS